MPTLVFLFVYLGQLLRIGEEEAAEEMLSAMMDDDLEEQPVVIPRGSRVSDDAWQVSTPARIGDGCRLHGNVRATSMTVGRDNEVFGGLRAKEGVTLGAGTEVAGNVTTRSGTVRVGPDALVRGDVAADFVELHDDAEVQGSIRAREETTIVTEPVLEEPPGMGEDGPGGESDATGASSPDAGGESSRPADEAGEAAEAGTDGAD
jgi:predicted acyltransferase (DUF342 family)